MIGHVRRITTRSSTVNKSPSESMSFITEVICTFIFTDVLMRNNYRPNRAIVNLYLRHYTYLAVEFQRNSESARQESQVNTSQPYKHKAVSSLPVYAA